MSVHSVAQKSKRLTIKILRDLCGKRTPVKKMPGCFPFASLRVSMTGQLRGAYPVRARIGYVTPPCGKIATVAFRGARAAARRINS